MAFLEVNDIKKNFGKTEVLKGVSFSLEEGQVLSVIGSSGNGKTTLLRCLNYLEFADFGTVTLNGKTISDGEILKLMKEDEIRENRLHFGLVFQSFNLFPQYKVFDNVVLAPNMLLEEEVKEYKKQLKDENLTFSERRLKVKNYIKERKEQIKIEGLEILDKVGLKEKTNHEN